MGLARCLGQESAFCSKHGILMQRIWRPQPQKSTMDLLPLFSESTWVIFKKRNLNGMGSILKMKWNCSILQPLNTGRVFIVLVSGSKVLYFHLPEDCLTQDQFEMQTEYNNLLLLWCHWSHWGNHFTHFLSTGYYHKHHCLLFTQQPWEVHKYSIIILKDGEIQAETDPNAGLY